MPFDPTANAVAEDVHTGLPGVLPRVATSTMEGGLGASSISGQSTHSLRSILRKSRPYGKPNVFDSSTFTICTSQRGMQRSLFSGGSNASVFSLSYTKLGSLSMNLSQEPNLEHIQLPVNLSVLYNQSWYPPSLSASKSTGPLPFAARLGLNLVRGQLSNGINDVGLGLVAKELHRSAHSVEQFADTYSRNLLAACIKFDLPTLEMLSGWKRWMEGKIPERVLSVLNGPRRIGRKVIA